MKWVPALAAFLVLGWASSLSAQDRPFDEALRAYHAGMLGEALGAFEQALERPGNSPERLTTIHLHLGILRASMGRTDEARQSMRVAVALSPELAAPSEVSPDARAMLDEARAAQGGRPLSVRGSSDAPGVITVAVARAPEGLVDRVLLRIDGGETIGERAVPPPEGGQLRVEREHFGSQHALGVVVEALDEHGGVLARATIPVARPAEPGDAPAVTAAADPSPVTPLPAEPAEPIDDESSVWSSPWLWLAVAVVIAGGVAGTLLLTASEDNVLGAPMVRMR